MALVNRLSAVKVINDTLKKNLIDHYFQRNSKKKLPISMFESKVNGQPLQYLTFASLYFLLTRLSDKSVLDSLAQILDFLESTEQKDKIPLKKAYHHLFKIEPLINNCENKSIEPLSILNQSQKILELIEEQVSGNSKTTTSELNTFTVNQCTDGNWVSFAQAQHSLWKYLLEYQKFTINRSSKKMILESVNKVGNLVYSIFEEELFKPGGGKEKVYSIKVFRHSRSQRQPVEIFGLSRDVFLVIYSLKASPFPRMDLPQNLINQTYPLESKIHKKLEQAAGNLPPLFRELEETTVNDEFISRFNQVTNEFIIAVKSAVKAVKSQIQVTTNQNALVSYIPQKEKDTTIREPIPVEIINIINTAIEKLEMDAHINELTNINRNNRPEQFQRALQILGFNNPDIIHGSNGCYNVVPLQNLLINYDPIIKKINDFSQERISDRQLEATAELRNLCRRNDLRPTTKFIGCIGLIEQYKNTSELTQSFSDKSPFLIMLEQIEALITQGISKDIFTTEGFSLLRYLSLSENLYASKKMIKKAPLLIQEIRNLLLLLFPRDLGLIVIDYMLPSIFGRVSVHFSKFPTPSQIQLSFPVHIVDVIPQLRGSSDCGYWTLYNTFMVLSEMAYSDSLLRTYHHSNFPKLKNITKQYLNKKDEDLTALDLKTLLNIVSDKKESQFNQLFPKLSENLILLEETLGIPSYTIISSPSLNEEQKLDPSFVFGGCIPQLKMRLTVNFYILSQNKDQRLFHLVLIGAGQHWFLQLLTFSFGKPGSIKSFLFDSDFNPAQSKYTLQRISSHLQNILNNPEAYAENVAQEIFPSMSRDLEKAIEQKNFNKTQVSLIQNHCEILIQFFSTFGKLPMAREFLSIFEFGWKAALNLKNNGYSEFKDLAAKLKSYSGLFSTSASSTTAQQPSTTQGLSLQ